jgi:hypothetical protein
MVKFASIAVIFVAIALISACKAPHSASAAKTITREARLPSAEEVFHLRSECAQLAEKKLESNVVGPALTQSQLSHYNPQTNRCYVKVTVQTANLSDRNIYASDYLYDGQTGELLASHTFRGTTCPIEPNCKTTGIVFDEHHQMKRGTSTAQDAEDYIDSMMDDPRER